MLVKIKPMVDSATSHNVCSHDHYRLFTTAARKRLKIRKKKALKISYKEINKTEGPESDINIKALNRKDIKLGLISLSKQRDIESYKVIRL